MNHTINPAGEEDLPQVPLSALEHYAYCPRQCGLIMLEDAFTDDAATIRGTLQHKRVDTPGNRGRRTVRTLHALPVWHDTIGLTGRCDTVELHDDGTILPVEHKSGHYRAGGAADIQAAAQAICLEEMFQRPVPYAVVYTAKDRRRHHVAVDALLRSQVQELVSAIQEMLGASHLPSPAADNRCRRCSMVTDCMPSVLARTRRYQQALNNLYDCDPSGTELPENPA